MYCEQFSSIFVLIKRSPYILILIMSTFHLYYWFLRAVSNLVLTNKLHACLKNCERLFFFLGLVLREQVPSVFLLIKLGTISVYVLGNFRICPRTLWAISYTFVLKIVIFTLLVYYGQFPTPLLCFHHNVKLSSEEQILVSGS